MAKILFEINSQKELEKLITEAFKNVLDKTISRKKELKEELLTSEELGVFLKLSRVSIWSLTKKGILPYFFVGNQKRYLKSDVLKKLSEFKSEGK